MNFLSALLFLLAKYQVGFCENIYDNSDVQQQLLKYFAIIYGFQRQIHKYGTAVELIPLNFCCTKFLGKFDE